MPHGLNNVIAPELKLMFMYNVASEKLVHKWHFDHDKPRNMSTLETSTLKAILTILANIYLTVIFD